MPVQVKQQKHIGVEDLEIVRLFKAGNPQMDRGEFGTLLHQSGLGIGHHTHSGCADRLEYINLVLDYFPDLD